MPTEILGKVIPEKIPDIQSIVSDIEIGYILEVDLEAPVHLHDFFTDYLLAFEKQLIPENWLNLYNERLVKDKEVGNGKYVSEEKLVQTLFIKKNYMKDYIEKNIRKRKIAKANGNEFGVMYYKLKNNAVFGKQMENVYFKVFEGGITAVHMLKSTVTLNKLIYVGQAILDISKTMMFNFWYGYIKPHYEDKACLLYTNTDSLIMWIETEDIYKDQAERPDIFDLNYSGDLFLIKNETKGDPIGESVCLKPKMYSVLPAGHNPKTPNDPDSEDPKKKHECLRNKKLTWHDMYGLCSYDYQIYLERRIELYKRLIASEIFPKEAEERTMKVKLYVKT
uniref:Uncharacterized protein n=1 Tax=Rhizophagus irregularis (strain DAOM 181602 / DAOM 197198 / MUCL 43194) TaxID=747089 RepID=U9SG93_RHIID